MFRRCFVLLTTLAVGLGSISAPAMAADGRATNAQGEIRAVLHHTMGRNADGPQPDRHNVPYYEVGVKNLGCQWGVVDATFRMATSVEAQRRWGHRSQDLAGMLYAALLDRAPDDGGLQAYTRAIGTYGLSWSTRQMMGSVEYRRRLVQVCAAGTTLSASVFDWQSAMDYAGGRLLDDTIRMAKVCGSQKAIEKLTAFKDNAKRGRALVGIAGEGARVLNGWLGNDPCKATLEMAKAIAYIAYTVYETGYDGHNPVFIQLSTSRDWVGMQSFKYRIGPNPTSWRAFGGKSF
uniref:hypothetical protein n=1 Tax=Paractinoplanes polyasparticus TaxID=2856853 RepID=UPI001C84DD61|nr:hypothetical protein [Actinoplanes polyasparticus]